MKFVGFRKYTVDNPGSSPDFASCTPDVSQRIRMGTIPYRLFVGRAAIVFAMIATVAALLTSTAQADQTGPRTIPHP